MAFSIALPLMLSLLVLQQPHLPARLDNAVPPVRPLQTVQGGEVLIEAQVDRAGKTGELRLLHGQAPFAGHALRSVSQWSFTPAGTAEPIESQVGVVVLFLPRAIFPTGSPTRRYEWPLPGDDRAPLPISISLPRYPINSIAEGVVILELRIASNGTMEALTVVRDIPSLTEAARAAVRLWNFSPARALGEPVPGTLIAVISFQRPFVPPPKQRRK